LRHFADLVALNNFNALSVFSLTHLGDLSPVKLAGQKSPMISTTSALAKEKYSFLWRFIFQFGVGAAPQLICNESLKQRCSVF
jgi:hypothetical protein